MKYIIPIFIASVALALSACSSPTKVTIEHRDIPSSLPTGSILRIPRKIAYLDEGKVPPEVLLLAIQYQKIRETGKLRDIIPLEFPEKPSDPEKVSRRLNLYISREARDEPALLVLEEIEYTEDSQSAKIRSENWQFRFQVVGYRQSGSIWVNINRTDKEKYRITTTE